MTVFFAEVGDVGAGRFEDPQPEQAEHGDEGEVRPVRGGPCGTEQGFKLQVGQAEGRGLRGDGGAADVVGRGVFEDTVDHAGAVEAGDDGGASGHC